MPQKVLRKKNNKKPFDNSGGFFVVDIETDKLEATEQSLVFGCVYFGENNYKIFRTKNEFLEIIESPEHIGKTMFAHNGGGFDYLALFGNLRKLHENIFIGSRFICAKYKGIMLADSFNVLPTSVKNLGKNLGIEKLEIEYIKINRKKITDEQIKYCVRDCEIVFKNLLIMFELTGKIKITIGSCALEIFRTKYQHDNLWFNELSYEFGQSYYGGRVECFKIGKTHSYKYDINSMYPYAMLKATFPNPSGLREGNSDNYLYYLNNKLYEGQIKCTVKHSFNTFGYLPLRKDGKLIFPVGTFSGTWNFNEFRYALKSGLIKVLNVERIIYAPKIESPFVDFVNDLYNKRKKAKGIFNLIYKLVLNNLYGKFAQKEQPKEQYFENIDFEYLENLYNEGIKFDVEYFDETLTEGIIKIKPDKIEYAKTAIPVYSSYITSYARVLLLQFFEKYRDKKITYCDTDSICCEHELGLNGTELGEFKQEKEIIIEIFGNKRYTQILDNGNADKKIKGVPKNAEYIGNNTYIYTKITKSKESSKRKIIAGQQQKVTKVISNNYDKRKITESGKTQPLEICISE